MGLFSKFLGAPKKAGDDAYLLFGMLLMCAADGDFQEQEMLTVQAFCSTLPEFRGKDLRGLLQQAGKQFRSHKSLDAAVQSLSAIESPAVRRKLFVLAADLALSSGDVDEGEEQLLKGMQGVLGIDQVLAEKVFEVLALKYVQ